MKSRGPLTSLMSLDPLVLLIITLPSPWHSIFAAILLLLFGVNYLSRVVHTLPWPFDKPDTNLVDPSQRKKQRPHRRCKPHHSTKLDKR
jgi:hypothetical protein